MTKEELKDTLWQLRCLLDKLETKSEHLSTALCLNGKGDAVYHYLQMLEVREALDAYKALNPDQQRQFMKAINEGESK